MYIKVTYSNGYYSCEEEDYTEVIDAKEADEYVRDGVLSYGFFEPDDRFIDTDDEEEYEAYQEECFENSYWEEISEEEYKENC